MSAVENFNAAWRDKSIYENAKDCFFIQVTKHMGKYDVFVDRMWMDSWQLPIGIGENIKSKNPKCYWGLSEDQFNQLFERI